MKEEKGQAPAESPEPDSGTGPRGLHPATIWLPLVQVFRTLAIAFLILAVSAGVLWMVVVAGAFVLLPFTLFQISRYLTFRYEVRETDLIISSGTLWRQERRIPLRRVQDTEIEQSPVHRWLRLARLKITTAGSEGQEAELDVISLEEAERVRSVILSCQNALSSMAEGTPEGPAAAQEVLLRLPISTLLLGGLASNGAASLGALLGVVVYFEWVVRLGNRYIQGFSRYMDPFVYLSPPLARLISIPPAAQKALETADYLEKLTDRYWYLSLVHYFLDESLGKAVIVIAGGLIVALVVFAVRHFNYCLCRSGGTLTSTKGLLTSSTNSLSQDHLVAMKVEENLIQRWLGLASVAVDSGGDQAAAQEARKRESFIPVVHRKELPRLLQEILPDLAPDVAWRPVSRKAILRGSRKGWLATAGAATLTQMSFGWYSLACLPLLPLVYYVNVRKYRHTGYKADGKHLVSRKGGFNRQTLYLPVRNLQSVIVTENYFDRRLGLATLVVDTAGQTNTGGGPSIGNLPAAEARQLQVQLGRSVAHSTTLLPRPASAPFSREHLLSDNRRP